MDGNALFEMWVDAMPTDTNSDVYKSDRRLAYQFLDAAAVVFFRETKELTDSVAITTVEEQQAYDLPAGFLGLYLKDGRDRHFIKYDDGSGDYTYPAIVPYERIFRSNPEAQDRPTGFAIVDRASSPALLEGTADAAGAKTGGQCTLQDDSMAFLTTDRVYPRDIAHNTEDGSNGVVLSITDGTHLVTALFNGKTNAWAEGDAYVIQRGGSKQIVLDHPSLTSGHTMTVPFLGLPNPVYSDYGFWRFTPAVCRAIVFEAIFMYRNRSGEAQKKGAGRHHPMFAEEINRIKAERARIAIQGGRGRNLP